MKIPDLSIADKGPLTQKPPAFPETAVVSLNSTLPAAKLTAPNAVKPPPELRAVAFRRKIDEFCFEELQVTRHAENTMAGKV